MATVKLQSFEGKSVDELRSELNNLINELEYILYNLSEENFDEKTAKTIRNEE